MRKTQRSSKDVIKFVRDLKRFHQTDDPYVIADYYGIQVRFSTHLPLSEYAETIKIDNYPTVININDKYSEFSKKVLCAHELGHALLHCDGINHFKTTRNNSVVECEANLFAIALLSDDNINDTLNIPIENLSNYILKTILDYNIST